MSKEENCNTDNITTTYLELTNGFLSNYNDKRQDYNQIKWRLIKDKGEELNPFSVRNVTGKR